MGATTDRIFVSWTEQWALDEYIDNYVRSRRLPPGAHEMVRELIAGYPAKPPFTKSDLDFFLDANPRRGK